MPQPRHRFRSRAVAVLSPALSAAVAAAVAAACFVPTTHAADFTFIGTGNADWSTAANWQSGAPPADGAFDTWVTIAPPAGATVVANNNLSTPADPFTLNVLRIGGTAAGATQVVTGAPLEFVYGAFDTTINGPRPGVISRTIGPVSVTSHARVENEVIFNRDLILSGFSTLNSTLAGPLKGSGRLTPFNGNWFLTNPNNTYSGGTFLNGQGTLTLNVTGSGKLGPGPVTVNSSRLVLDTHANATSDQQITLGLGGVVVFGGLHQAAINRLHPSSNGLVAIPGTMASSPLDLRNYPGIRIGTSLPAGVQTASYAALIEPASASNLPWFGEPNSGLGTFAYRFGGMKSGVTINSQSADTLRITAPLTDNIDGFSTAVDIAGPGTGRTRGGKVQITNFDNTYTGGTIVGPGGPGTSMTALSIDFTTPDGASPFGFGPIDVYGTLMFEGTQGRLGFIYNPIRFKPGGVLMFNNVIGNNPWQAADNVNRWPDDMPVTLNSSGIHFFTKSISQSARENVGNVTFNGPSDITIDHTGGTPFVTTFRVGGLVRGLDGTLTLTGRQQNAFNHTSGTPVVERFEIDDTSIVDPTTLMVHPSIVGVDTSQNIGPLGWFLRPVARPGGTALEYFAPVPFDDNSDNEVAHYGGAVMSNVDQTVHAVRILAGYTLPIPSGKKLTVQSGGVIGGSIGGAGTLVFENQGAPTEGFFFINDDDGVVSVPIHAPVGFTKFGSRALTLAADNEITGPIVINDGDLVIGHANAIDPGTPFRINRSGDLNLNGHDLTINELSGDGGITNLGTTTNTLTIDSFGDILWAGRLTGAERGSRMQLTKRGGGNLTLSGTHVYSGLTKVEEGTLTITGQRTVIVPAPGQPEITPFGNFEIFPGANLVIGSEYHVAHLGGQGTTTVTPAGILNARRVRQTQLVLEPGGTLRIIAGARGSHDTTSRLASPQIPEGARLDLTDSALVLDDANFADVKNMVSGGEIISSALDAITALVVINNNRSGAPVMSVFSGQAVDANDVLLKVTYEGDANLDGRVNIYDYLIMDRAAARGIAGIPSGGRWLMGDFNDDGTVDAADYFLADNAFLQQGLPFASALGPATSPGGGAGGDMAASPVPEPGALGMLAAGGILLRRRRSAWRKPRGRSDNA